MYHIYKEKDRKLKTLILTHMVGHLVERPNIGLILIVHPITTKCDLVEFFLLGFSPSDEPNVHLLRLATSNDDPKE